MDRKTLTAHMVVKNEEKWIWYSIMSIIDYVDKMVIFDTGSSDKTVEIINAIIKKSNYVDKIVFREKGNVDNKEFTKLRQEQIEMTETRYFLVVDGDEIWYKKSIEELIKLVNSKEPYLVATKFVNCAGDIYHYRNFERENYNINGIVGSITIRLYSMKIPGIHCGGDYGVEGYYDIYDKPVQSSKWNIEMMEGYYFHTSLLQRSSSVNKDFEIQYRRKKVLYEWDHKFHKNFKYPEVFYMEAPSCVSSPWKYKVDILRKSIYFLKKLKRCMKNLIGRN